LKDFKQVPDNLGLSFKDITFINFESLHKLDRKIYQQVIIDEVQRISAFPKPNKARKMLPQFINQQTKIIWMSGTPAVESNSQMYHIFSLHPLHPFAKYKNFYKWFKDGYGVLDQNGDYLKRFIGRGQMTNIYTDTHDFRDKYLPFTIALTREQAGHYHHTPKINRVFIDTPDWLISLHNTIKTSSIAKHQGHVFLAESGASKLTKMQQIASGTCINTEDQGILLSKHKVNYIKERYKDENITVLYKYKAEEKLLRSIGIPHINIDSGTTGLDLSHKDRLVIMTLTFSGTNFLQGITRLCNANRASEMEVDVILSKETIDNDILKLVERKQTVNTKTLSLK
jgi:hypothetical protein